MALDQILGGLTGPEFVAELHHLLATDPGDAPGQGWDLGWSCRDHALLAGLVARLLGLDCRLAHGEACFVQGPAAGVPPWGLRAELHTWLDAGPAGAIDLSPQLDRGCIPPFRPWPLCYVAAGRCLPSGTFEAAADAADLRNRVNLALRTPGACGAVYLTTARTPLDRQLLYGLPAALNSPLSQWLAGRYRPGIYSKAARHLYGLLRGERPSLRRLPRPDAWDAIAAVPGGAREWLVMKGAV